MRTNNIFGIITLLAAVILCSCSSDDGNNHGKGADDSQQYRNSVLIYIAAQNSLGYLEPGYTSASVLDSAEIVKGATKLSNTQDNVFLFIDDAQKPRLYRLFRTGSGAQMRTQIDKVLTWSTDANSADPATLRDVLTFISQQYPSLSYGLVMWSHGDGWLPSTNKKNTLNSGRSICIDVGSDGDMANDTDIFGEIGTQMDIADMAEAVSQSGVHLDYILFDACLMQNIEVAYDLRNVADYIIGSANITSAYGAYYTNLIPNALMAHPFDDQSAINIANQYYYDAVDNEQLHIYYGETGNANSVIKTAPLEQLATATGQYLNKAISERRSPDMQGVQAYCSSTIFNSPEFYDMGSAMHNLLETDDYQAWLNIAKQCVISHNISPKYSIGIIGNGNLFATLNDAEHSLGVSMFIPQERYDHSPYSPYNTLFRQTAWYTAALWSHTGW